MSLTNKPANTKYMKRTTTTIICLTIWCIHFATAIPLWTAGPAIDSTGGPGLVAEDCFNGEHNSTLHSFCIQNSGTLAFTIGSDDNLYTNAKPGINFSFLGTAILENCAASLTFNLSKTIIGTSETGTSDTQDGSTGNERPVAIGEVVTYSLSFIVPEGTTNDISILDNLPDGLQYVSGSVVFNSMSDDGITYATTVTGGTVPGEAVTFALGNVLNSDNDANNETITITFDAIVVNEIGNQDGMLLTSHAELMMGVSNIATSEERTVVVVEPNLEVTVRQQDDHGGSDITVGDMAGNRLQYQWRDSDNIQYTRNLIARVDIVEPNITLSTTTDVGMDVDAGDQVQFTINLNNTGSAMAYNLQVLDVLPFVGVFQYVSFEAVDLATSTCDNLGGFTVNATNPPNLVFSFDELAANTSCSITFTGIVDGAVTPNETYINQVSVTSYTSQPNTADPDVRIYTGGNASSTITTKEPVLVKSYVSTSEAHTDPADTRSGANDANEVPLAIGEIIRYNIALTLIEGLHINLIIEDLLPTGLEALYNNKFQVTIPAGVNTTNSGLISGATTSIYNDEGMLLVTSFNLSPNPRNLSFFLGTVTTNTNRDNNVSEVIVIAFDAIVLNSAAANNSIGRNMDNRATFSEGSGNSSAFSNTVHARIQEPVVNISKTLNTALSNPTGTDSFKNGDQVVYDIILTAGNASNQTTAFDLKVLDNLSADLNLASPVVVIGAPAYAMISDNSDYIAPGQSVDVNISELRPGDAITIRVTTTVNSNACSGSLSNPASLTYTSLPGLQGTNDATPGNSGTDKGERNGSGGTNDYSGSDNAMISLDQHPDFTLNVVQPSCFMAGSISFTELTGGTHTYAYSSNGVDYSPLTPDMGQLSIALPAGEQPATTYSIRVIRTDPAPTCETIITANIQEVSDCCPGITAVLSGTTTICPGSGTNINVVITEGLDNYTVIYSPDGGNTTSTVSNYTSGSDLAVTPTQTTTYTLVSVSDSENCPAMVSGSAIVTVEDVTDPVFDCNTLITIMANTNSETCNANVSITIPTATDNCDGPLVATGVRDDMTELFAPYPTGTTIITWTFQDEADNSIQCLQYVVVTDNTPPVITCPDTQTLVLDTDCSASTPNYTALATPNDNCGVLGLTQSPLAGTTVSDVGNMTVTLMVTDVNGLTNTCSFTVNKVDNTLPTISCPDIQTLVLDADCSASIPNYTALATPNDNCGVLGVTQSPIAGTSVSDAGNMTVTLMVTDVNGLENSCSFNVNKVDNTAPSITCPGNQTLILAADCTASLPDYISLALEGDNCGVQGVTQSPLAGTSVSDAGNMTVTMTVTDVNGLTNSCSFNVTKFDNTLSTITCPNTQTLVLDTDCSASLPDYTTLANPDDNCGVLGVTQSPLAGTTVSDAGNMTVTLTVTDVNGMSNNCSITVTTEDNTPPAVECFNQTINFNGEMNIPLDSDDLVETADNCGIQSISLSPDHISSNQVGQTVPVLLTVTDNSELTSTCISQITLGGLPSGWSQNVNGVGCSEGSFIGYDSETEVWTATSTNCFYSSPFTSDANAFAQRTLCGNGSITAEITDISGTALGWAGIVMRESNAPGAKKVQVMTNLSNFLRREVRSVTNGPAHPQQIPAFNRYWLRLTRTGNQIVAHSSSDGVNWFQVLAVNLTMNSCIEIGLVVTNSNQNSTVTATFENVSYTGNGPIMPVSNPDNILSATANKQPDFSVYPKINSPNEFSG